MLSKLGASVSSFRQQHPRFFLASVCGWLVIGIIMISKPERLADAPGIRHLQYNYPPVSTSAGIAEMEKQAVIDQTEPAFGPRNLTSAVARSEQLWASNVEKRKAFVESKGGYDAIRMFSDKAWVGYGQMWTLW